MQSNELYNELSQNFIEYAVACNTDRAIPDAESGLKPVARRILYGAYIGKRSSSKPHVKNARIVGDVMGQFHPHGDSSIYGALVRLSQDWILRYPLIDFHGNQGSIAGDGPAASRYTEGRLSKLAESGLLAGLKKNNVDFIPNYDETTEEPVTLPSIFPNLLCNPNTGIGVAMACNWLPHNLREVAAAIYDYMDGKEPMIPGPDFPTGGVVINKDDIPGIMKTGHGSVKVRARYKVEKKKLVFYEIPYGQTIENLIAEIGKVAEEEIPEISDVHDESNKKGIRIVVEVRNVDPESIVNKLFIKTNLQTSISYNQVALIDKTPTELNLKQCCEVYVKHNINCITREAQFDLEKAEARRHVLEGLLKALEDIDNIIALIKKSASSNDAKDKLMEKYKFTEPQAKAILGMRLSSLANMEKVELQKEKAELEKDIHWYQALLGNPDIQKSELKSRLEEIVKKFGDARRTELAQITLPKEEKEIEMVVPEDVVVVVTKAGSIKRIPRKSFKTQKRNGKGVKTEDSAILTTISTNTIDTLMVFGTTGKMYRLIVDDVPVGTNVSKGTNINTLVNMEPGEKLAAVTSLYRKSNAEYVVFITKQGLIKKTKLEEYTKTKKKTGIQAIKIKDSDEIANITFLNEEDLILVTEKGMAIHFETKDIAPIGRIASGVKGIKLAEGDKVVIGLPLHSEEDELAIFTNSKMGKKMKLDQFPVQGRGGRGVSVYKPESEKIYIAGAAMVTPDDEVLILGSMTSICISAADIPSLSRTSVGNMMIKSGEIRNVVKL